VALKKILEKFKQTLGHISPQSHPASKEYLSLWSGRVKYLSSQNRCEVLTDVLVKISEQSISSIFRIKQSFILNNDAMHRAETSLFTGQQVLNSNKTSHLNQIVL